MKGKKETKVREVEEVVVEKQFPAITSKSELKAFVASVRDKLITNAAPPVLAMAALNHVMSIPEVYDYLDSSSKEIMQEIWVKLSQLGIQIRKPTLLFGDAA